MFAEEFSEGRESHGVLLADWRVRVVPRLAALSGLRELFSQNLSLAGHLHSLGREHPDLAIRFEERDLAPEHGEVYERYRRAVPRLVPFARSRRSATQAGTDLLGEKG